jgi:hypothetical protein
VASTGEAGGRRVVEADLDPDPRERLGARREECASFPSGRRVRCTAEERSCGGSPLVDEDEVVVVMGTETLGADRASDRRATVLSPPGLDEDSESSHRTTLTRAFNIGIA